jgi:hypothetical protein
MSVSRMPVRRPRRANERATFTNLQSKFRPFLEKHSQQVPAMVDLPTPPLAEETAITFFTSLMRLRSGNPRCIRGIVPARGNPFVPSQLFVKKLYRYQFNIPKDSHAAKS